MYGSQAKNIRIIGIVLIVIGVLFGAAIPRGNPCIGDEVFGLMGIPAWSNGTTGTHYPALIGAIIILIGTILMTVASAKKKRILGWSIVMLLIWCLLNAVVNLSILPK